MRNPVLPGSHPDPSIARVGAEYYVARSTFEWGRQLCLWARDLAGAYHPATFTEVSCQPAQVRSRWWSCAAWPGSARRRGTSRPETRR
nr:family 43 glycosylhydrolase [Cellulomonas sp. Root137]